MAGPTQTNLPVTPGSGSTVSGYTNGAGYFGQAVAADSNPAVTNTAWTSATSANTALTTNCAGYGTTVVTFMSSGTITAGVVTFEAYDGTNWWAVPAARVNGLYTEPTLYSLVNGSQAWKIDTSGFQQVRVRLSTVITGSGNATFQMLVQAFAPNVGVQANLVTALSQAIDSITTYPYGHSQQRIAVTTGTIIKTGAGSLAKVVINNPSALTAATTATTITLYDGTTTGGTVLHVLTLPVSANLAGAMPFSISLDEQFTNGLFTAVTLGTSGSWTPDITYIYR